MDKKPKVVLILPCHNQEDIISFHLKRLREQTRQPDHVVIVDDHSDPQTLGSSQDGWLRVVKGHHRGRSTTRNRGIEEALSMGADILVFMDGDSVVEDDYYFERLETFFEDPTKATLVFGTRIHHERPVDFDKWYDEGLVDYHRFQNKPSDLLTANMDNLMRGYPLEHKDLRDVAGVTEAYGALETFEEKVDFILTGMVTWSCSFAITAKALQDISLLLAKTYGLYDMWFDEVAFRTQWGYEDIAFGLDALYAGVDLHLQNDSRIIHFMHGRTDDIFTHVQGKHLIMDRYRRLLKKGSSDLRNETILGTTTLCIQGRSFEKKKFWPDFYPVVITARHIRAGSYIYDFSKGDFIKSRFWNIIGWLKKILL